MNQKIQIRKSLYKKEAIIVALQMYLKKYWVAILEDESDYFIQFEPKMAIISKFRKMNLSISLLKLNLSI
jgi:hypothetical protein